MPEHVHHMTAPAPLRILSMGWGIQTWTLAAMMALDEMPRTDYLVFSDTRHEGAGTYEFRRQWEPWLGERGLTVVTVEQDETEVVREDWGRGAVMIPAFTVADADGAHGQIGRQCTGEWKVRPIRRWVRAELARRGIRVQPGIVECWIGISLDEAVTRMRSSDVQYVVNRYPLVEQRVTRAGCIEWLESRGLPVPPKSACTFCPYQSRAAWRQVKRNGGADWAEAVAVDEAVRGKRPMHGPLYVHPARRPLSDAVKIPEDEGVRQGSFDDEGICDGGWCHV